MGPTKVNLQHMWKVPCLCNWQFINEREKKSFECVAAAAAAAAKSLQSCQTLCDPMDCSPLGSSVHGIFQARVLSNLLLITTQGASLGTHTIIWFLTSLVAQTVKASAYNTGDLGSIPGLGRSPGEGNSNPLQYSCLENPMDRGAWQAKVHGVAKSQTWLSDFT